MSLYIVGTPIGNLKDITLRALETLKLADIVLVEKWTDSIKLLKYYEIKPAQIISYDDRNAKRLTPRVLELAKDKEVALITSAGMPGVSDPGTLLVKAAREEGLEISVIPGVSALTSAISLSGWEGEFHFVGFLPKKKGQIEKMINRAKEGDYILIFFESTYRLKKTLEFLREKFSEADVLVAKELTKQFEQVLKGTPAELVTRLEAEPKLTKGEFTVLVRFL